MSIWFYAPINYEVLERIGRLCGLEAELSQQPARAASYRLIWPLSAIEPREMSLHNSAMGHVPSHHWVFSQRPGSAWALARGGAGCASREALLLGLGLVPPDPAVLPISVTISRVQPIVAGLHLRTWPLGTVRQYRPQARPLPLQVPSNSLAPARSARSAECTHPTSASPAYRPTDGACGSCCSSPHHSLGDHPPRRFDLLAVNDRCMELRITASLISESRMQRPVEPLSEALQAPEAKIVVHRFPGRQAMRQQTPGTAAPQEREMLFKISRTEWRRGRPPSCNAGRHGAR